MSLHYHSTALGQDRGRVPFSNRRRCPERDGGES